MKKLELFVIVLLITSALYSQNTQYKKFSSRELNDDRILKIYVPPGYADDESKLYPLTIVLDAEYLFDVYVGNSILFSAKEKAPEQIIVGINQNQFNERIKDCAYSEENSLPTKDSEA
ncbi:MAG: alpha/beta hydrolase, partial [Lutibacter sp.]